MEGVIFTEPDVARLHWADLGRTLWSPPYRRAFAWAVPMLLLAYGFAMTNFTLAGDDWFAVFPEANLDTHFALVAGRWLMPVVWAVTGHGAFVPFFSFAVALVLLALAGLVAAAVWDLTRPWAVFAVVTLFVVNPLFTDTLSTKPGHVSLPLAMVCAALAAWVLLRWRGARIWRIAASAGLLVLSLASYQPTGLTFAVVVLGYEVITVGWGRSPYWRRAWARWLEVLVVVVAGLAVYLVSVRVAWWVTGTDPQSARSTYSMTAGYPSTLGEIADAVRYGLRMIGRFWFGDTTLYPVALKAVSLALAAAGVLAAMAAAGRARRESRGSRLGVRAWVLALGLASLLIPFAVLFVREDPPLRGSVFTTLGLVVGLWAGLLLDQLTAGVSEARRRWVEVTGVALVLVAVLGCAHQVNQGYFGLYLGNQRDLANANRMLSVMEQMADFDQGAEIRVRMVGTVRFGAPGPPFTNIVARAPGLSIVNCSGLACQDRLVNMLNLIGGGRRAFVSARDSGDPAVQSVIATMPSWPKAGSIRFLEGTFVIKGRS
jgi:hypothetical protein